MTDDASFAGLHAVVSGAGSGIGRVLVEALLERGAVVSTIHRSSTSIARMGDLVSHERLQACVADLRKREQIERVVHEITAQRPPVDILVNAAGVWHDDERAFHGPELPDIPIAEIEDVIQVGVIGAMTLTRGLLHGMRSRKSGKVLFLSCGFAGPHEARGWVHYYTANRAIDAAVAGIAAECRPYHIQVNGLAPWFVGTDAVARFYPEESAKGLRVDELVSVALFLLSPGARHVSGEVIEVRSEEDIG